MKPTDWNYAPEWANYIAMDEDGRWYWYENKPIPRTANWYPTSGNIEEADCVLWKDTLHKRPEGV